MRLIPSRLLVGLGAPAVALLSLVSTAKAQLVFNLTPAPAGITAQATTGFQQAGARWSSFFSDSVTINLEIGFSALGPGILASASSVSADYTYTSVRSALLTDALSADDISAVAHLPAAPAVNLMLNYTSNSPNGSGSPTPYVDNDGDANNTTINVNNANAKALGLLSGTNLALDASITFSNAFNWDFDSSDGITSGFYDFVGIAAHEIGHSLGFVSGVDVLDTNSTSSFFRDDQFIFVSPLDLYRRSALSLANGGDSTLDWTAGNSGAYFSIDGGVTNLALFATGRIHGDGRQASHWKDNLGIGVMDPTAATGELLTITARDVQGFDVIGWNLSALSAPEPGTLALALLGIPAIAARRRRRA
ncbi:NF038122 family metalloprotease [Armatimonas sp.]|uniref:NF038122 family metalloprotease n=1 Tax=Armatimonas sp. TaxID=1872638 RepID=UPI0037538466